MQGELRARVGVGPRNLLLWAILLVIIGLTVIFAFAATSVSDHDIGLLALGISGIALLFAIVQRMDAQRTITHVGGIAERIQLVSSGLQETATNLTAIQVGLDKTTRTLGEIETAISTVFVGEWPEFMSVIAETVRSAEHELVILCDHPGYGVFSTPEDFDEYLVAIRTKAPRIPVKMMWMEGSLRETLRRNQFGPGSIPNWNRWRTEHRKQVVRVLERWQEYFPGETSPSDATSISREAFEALLDAIHAFLIEHRFRDVVRMPDMALNMPMYFWIADGRRAVVALVPAGPSAREIGFRTSDPNLISALQGIWNRFSAGRP